MKTKISILLLVCAFQMNVCKAQSFQDRLGGEFSVSATTENKGMKQLSVSPKLTVDFTPRLYGIVKADLQHALYNKEGLRTYYASTSLGGGLGINIARPWKTDNIDLRATVMSNVGKTDWHVTTYDLGLAWYKRGNRKRVVPVYEIGYRYSKSHTRGICDFSGFYVTIGFKF